jgi:DNA-binding NtrC family response regulator
MSDDKQQYPDDPGRYPSDEPESSTPPSALQRALQAELHRLAPSRVTVLLVGGSLRVHGTVARALHAGSARAAWPFVEFDCHGLDVDQVERGLFGGPAHAPARGGAIQRAAAGTLHLSCVDALPLLVQPRFLRFLEEARSVRVVASTLVDLLACVEHGLFRLDLAERLSVVELLLEGVA